MKKYEPIDCNYYDIIEHTATLKKEAEIKYLSEDGKVDSVKSRILDTETKPDGEYVLLEKDGKKIRMDDLIAIDDNIFKVET